MKMRIFVLALFITMTGLTTYAQGPGATTAPPTYAIQNMRITLVTGNDDLRNKSRVSAFIITRDGRRIQSPPLNCRTVKRNLTGPGWSGAGCAGIPNNTRRIFEWKFDNVEYVRPTDVHRFGLSFEGGASNPFETGDNWNLDRLEVEYFAFALGDKARSTGVGRLQPTQLLRPAAGKPMYRFKTREEWQSDPLGMTPSGTSEGIGIRPAGRRP
jgi:hypothetical protein